MVSVVELLIGIALLSLGGVMVFGRDRIVASHQRRFAERPVQPAMAWLVLGAILALAGVGQVVLAVT